MALREDNQNPTWLQAKEIISNLFCDDSNSEWLKLEQRKFIQTPSKAAIEDFYVEECCKVPAELKEGFDHIFEHCHVDTFWDDLVFKLKQATSIHPVASRKRKNEEHLVTSLIQPMLKDVVNSISVIPEKHTKLNGENVHQLRGTISSHLVIQDEIRMGNAPGQPPAVDAAIQISDGETCRVLIPVEVKVDIDRKHLYQIAAYVTKVSTAKELVKSVVIGIIIDKELFYLVFSPYSFLDKSGDEPVLVPLPVVYVSHPIRWRNRSPQEMFSIMPAALLVIACTCYFQLVREECDQKSINSQVLNVAHQLLQRRHKIEPLIDEGDLFQALNKKVKCLEEKVKELETKLRQKQNGTPTDSQSDTSVGCSPTTGI